MKCAECGTLFCCFSFFKTKCVGKTTNNRNSHRNGGGGGAAPLAVHNGGTAAADIIFENEKVIL